MLSLAGDEDLPAELHVAAAANPMLDAHDDVLPLVFEKPFVSRASDFIDCAGQVVAVGS